MSRVADSGGAYVPPKDGDPTPDLDTFLVAYALDDNHWWRLSCGHHQNLFEEAVARMERAEVGEPRG